MEVQNNVHIKVGHSSAKAFYRQATHTNSGCVLVWKLQTGSSLEETRVSKQKTNVWALQKKLTDAVNAVSHTDHNSQRLSKRRLPSASSCTQQVLMTMWSSWADWLCRLPAEGEPQHLVCFVTLWQTGCLHVYTRTCMSNVCDFSCRFVFPCLLYILILQEQRHLFVFSRW